MWRRRGSLLGIVVVACDGLGLLLLLLMVRLLRLLLVPLLPVALRG
jgi:hypothetical protein